MEIRAGPPLVTHLRALIDNALLVLPIIDPTATLCSVLAGKPARSCKDFISQ
jgi:hypothetical protein